MGIVARASCAWTERVACMCGYTIECGHAAVNLEAGMIKRVDAGLIAGLQDVSTGTLGHFLAQGFMDWEIQPMFRPVKLVGQALTVSCPPTDNSVLVDALERCSPGDVLVLHRHQDRRHAAWGGILSLAAREAGLAGVVIDGAATDWREITDMRFPVFCRNLSALTTRRLDLGGRVGEPVLCGGVTVRSGDIILGDEDGVVVIPQEDGPEALRLGQEKERSEARMRSALQKGVPLREAREVA